jgi:hypothetical protein
MKMKKTRALLTVLLIAASLVSPKAKAGAETAKQTFAPGDYAVVTYRLTGFDPSLLASGDTRAYALKLADSELSRLKTQDLLLSQSLKSAQRAAEHGDTLNPLLKHRANQAAVKASAIATDLARNKIQIQRMEILKKAAAGTPLSELETERVRLHEFKTLRAVPDVSQVSEMATRSIQKEAAMFGAKVTAVEKFSAPAWAKAVKLQAKTKMKIVGGVGVAVGVAVFGLYSDYEIERTETKLNEATEVPAQ